MNGHGRRCAGTAVLRVFHFLGFVRNFGGFLENFRGVTQKFEKTVLEE